MRRRSCRRLVAILVLVLVAPLGGLSMRAAAAARPRTIPFEAAEVTSPDGRVFTVSWRAAGVGRVRVFAGVDPEHIGRRRPVGQGGGAGAITVSALPDAPRWYFELRPDHGRALVVADRSLHLSTAGNFRDVGGYRTQTGQWVRVGVAYRSNALEALTPRDLDILGALHLRLITDLRTDEERSLAPDRVPPGVQDVPADVLAGDAAVLHAMRTRTAAAGGAAGRSKSLRDIYRDFVGLPSAREAYHEVFLRLAAPRNTPEVFHCTAGKDRTGWAQAVLLTILGVPRDTILADYALTNFYLSADAIDSLRRQYASGMAPARKGPMADPADLGAAFDEVTLEYGTFDAYLRQGLGLDEAALVRIRRTFLTG